MPCEAARHTVVTWHAVITWSQSVLSLLSATPSPFAPKVRIALAEKGVPFDLVTEVPWNHDATAPKVNPLGKIPVLLLEDDTAYYESRFILEYLETAYPRPCLIPRDPELRLAHRRLDARDWRRPVLQNIPAERLP